jgi:proto-chlorophyllide reductase subunit
MKFVCLNCETYMTFQKVEKPTEGSLGVFFTCPTCSAKFSMVTNPGETQMVSSLGVQLGGRTAAAQPFEMTRGTLKDEAQAGSGQMAAYLNEKIQAGQPASAHASADKPVSASVPAGNPAEASAKTGGGCPFSAMVAQMGLTASDMKAGAASSFTWSPDAKEKLEKLPAFVQPMVRSSVEAYARKHNYTTITLQVMDDSKNDSNGLAWAPDAERRLENIPDFIRPMARREVERIAKERGLATVTAQVMDEAKDKFMKFM